MQKNKLIQDRVKEAVKLFNGKEKYNCAQAILIAFSDICQVDNDTIIRAKSWGGGRAETKYCGALEAALYLHENYEVKEKIKESFQKQIGSCFCKEIRKNKLKSCKSCVELAAKLLTEI